MPSSADRTIFCTVGTTRFDKLVELVTRTESLEWMKANGYTNLVVQYGRGEKPTWLNTNSKNNIIPCRVYDFCSSLTEDMRRADLIISHAGAGTVMEALSFNNKRLVVVINTNLMDNHQTELAHQMGKRGHLFVVEEPKDLEQMDIWNDFDSFVPIPHEGGDEQDFSHILDKHFCIGIASASKQSDKSS